MIPARAGAVRSIRSAAGKIRFWICRVSNSIHGNLAEKQDARLCHPLRVLIRHIACWR